MSKRHNHCWKDLGEHLEETDRDAYNEWFGGRYPDTPLGGTCMLPDAHTGPHQFTPDDQITVSFAPKT
jgi:hypothetical protein